MIWSSKSSEPRVNTDKKHSLTSQTEQALRLRIAADHIRAGDKLPTEKALAQEFGVSRTVIREAIAALRADGLLEAKHGVGVFVSQKADGAEASQAPSGSLHFSSSMLDLLELRMAVEVHAAGLAAARRTLAQEAKIWAASERFSDVLSRNEPTEEADLQFHHAIAEATNNQAFVEFLDRLGLSILPRRALEGSKRDTLITHQYLEKTASEHNAIRDAIAQGDVEAARQAMKNHLGRSQTRYRGLVEAGKHAADIEDKRETAST